ncbi:MAG: hypothetical protein KTR28_00385 [Micavibrio sp.]|nr:hypothetical protein [Micavibrio sp.]
MLKEDTRDKNEIPQSKRYITLLGDPIHNSIGASLLKGSDLKLAALAPAFSAVCAEIMGDPEKSPVSMALSVLHNNISGFLLSRFIMEKFATNRFNEKNSLLIGKKELSSLCIDKFPDPETAVKSVTKYGLAIQRARLIYGIYGGVDIAWSAGGAIAWSAAGDLQGAAGALSSYAVELSRSCKGLHRFNQCAKGNWAIVDMPDPEKVTEKETKPIGREAFMPV